MRDLLSPHEKRLLRRLAAGRGDRGATGRYCQVNLRAESPAACAIADQFARRDRRCSKAVGEVAGLSRHHVESRPRNQAHVSCRNGRRTPDDSKIICAAATGPGLTNG
jgi:hypothetical protein